MAFYFLAQFLGYMMPIAFTDTPDGLAASPETYYICGMSLLLLGILDNWTFQFTPLQKNIFLDKEKGSYAFYRSTSEAAESNGLIRSQESSYPTSRASFPEN